MVAQKDRSSVQLINLSINRRSILFTILNLTLRNHPKKLVFLINGHIFYDYSETKKYSLLRFTNIEKEMPIPQILPSNHLVRNITHIIKTKIYGRKQHPSLRPNLYKRWRFTIPTIPSWKPSTSNLTISLQVTSCIIYLIGWNDVADIYLQYTPEKQIVHRRRSS